MSACIGVYATTLLIKLLSFVELYHVEYVCLWSKDVYGCLSQDVMTWMYIDILPHTLSKCLLGVLG